MPSNNGRRRFHMTFFRIVSNHPTPFRCLSMAIAVYSQCASWIQWACRFSKATVTPGLRPGYDLPATDKWAKRRENVRLVAEVVRLVAAVVCDRKGQISRSKVVVMLKTQSHRAYDQVTTYRRSKKCWNGGSIVERSYDWYQRSYDWSQRSWVIASGKSVASRSMVMFKTWNLLFQIVSGRTISRATGRATLRSVVPPIGCSLTL